MKYLAFLRGINVGGNTLIKMSELKIAFEKSGLKNVITYINSGNIVFESDEKDTEVLTKMIANTITKTFNFDIKVLIISQDELQKTVDEVPKEWKTKNDLRCYMAFLIGNIDAKEAAKEIAIREGIDSLDVGPGVLYMTTLMSGRTKSAFSKMMSKPVYKAMTLRNYTTAVKVLTLMDKSTV